MDEDGKIIKIVEVASDITERKQAEKSFQTEKGEVVVDIKEESRTEDEILLHFAAIDTGIGISEEKQQLIFESFTQVDSSMTRKHKGTGLGLAISKRLVDLMGGRIWVKSKSGKGSTFHFTLPLGLQRGKEEKLIPSKRTDLEDLYKTIDRVLPEIRKNMRKIRSQKKIEDARLKV